MMAFTPGPKLAQQLGLPRRYEGGDRVASVRADEERKMPEGMMTGAEMEVRIAELRAKGEVLPRLEALERKVEHESANLRTMIDGLARKIEGFGKLQASARAQVERAPLAPAVAEMAGASPVEGEGEAGQRLRGPSPPKPWELEGLSKATWYRRKREAGSGRSEEQKVGPGEQAEGTGGAAGSG